ncbi:MAG: type-F conjugative transfer system protein TraW [Defluviicoccus sp.]|nr:type-F conjugative transfer system protein TraW [Defluviicoccus sp.]
MTGTGTCAAFRPFIAAAFGVALALAAPAVATAKDLGVRGATWPVAEPDLLAQIEARLREMERSGELARLEDEARANARRKLEEPDPVFGIAPAREERSRLFDPAITVARDIRTPDGTLIAAAGMQVNPLERIALARDLLFVDGRREAEIAWALAHDRPAKIVLLAGRPLELMRRHRRPFFFDQGGRLAARFGLRFTPSLVEQAGSQLRITEVPVESLPPGSGDGDGTEAKE